MNLTDISVTPLHLAFDEVCRRAEARGVRVTGSELVGLVPRSALLDAGRYFLRTQHRSTGVAESELIRIAVRSLGLDELAPFNPEERIIEYLLRRPEDRRLATSTLAEFTDETASESPAPGGGSVAAAVGALGAALGTMVANLSAHKPGWDDRWEEFSRWAERGQELKEELLRLVDQDTLAFNQVMLALAMPKGSPGEKAARKQALDTANRGAIAVPFRVMQVAVQAFDLLAAMARTGNPASVSDAGVGALCARAAVRGAWLNVRINLPGLADRSSAGEMLDEGERLIRLSDEMEHAVLAVVEEKLRT